jgi:hypothetical protein
MRRFSYSETSGFSPQQVRFRHLCRPEKRHATNESESTTIHNEKPAAEQ